MSLNKHINRMFAFYIWFKIEGMYFMKWVINGYNVNLHNSLDSHLNGIRMKKTPQIIAM